MQDTTRRGALTLTAAQAWHALSGYLIFITAARELGPSAYGDFALVVFTMTAIEVLLVDGLPRAIAREAARRDGGLKGLAVMGLRLSFGVAVGLTALLLVLSPVLTRVWSAPELGLAIRLSSLDFAAFTAFAVLVQIANGQRAFGLQAKTWGIYSTAKVVSVLSAIAISPTIEAAILGYVIASSLGSLGALVLIQRRLQPSVAELPEHRALWNFGWPLALQSLLWMVVLNLDLWVLKALTDDGQVVGAYAAAATLAKAIFFIFRAAGDAMFPSVVRAIAANDGLELQRIVRKGLSQLCCLLFPVTALAIAAARPTLSVIYGAKAFVEGATILALLAPTAAAITLAATLSQLIAALGRPRLATLTVALAFMGQGLFLWLWTRSAAPQSVAEAIAEAFLVGGLGYLIATASVLARQGRNLIAEWRLIGALALGALTYAIMGLWHPEDFWVLPYGAALLVMVLALGALLGILPKKAEPAP